MAWGGFVKESKSYVNHPDFWLEGRAQLYLANGDPDPNCPGWTEKDRLWATFKFWWVFPRAWCRFYWQVLRDGFRGLLRSLL